MPSPYPLPQGCIFREDFRNPTLSARNGLVITGNPWLPNGAKGFLSKSGVLALVPRFSYPMYAQGFTFIADCTVSAFTGGYRTIFKNSNASSSPTIQIGLTNNSNKPFWDDGFTVTVPSGAFTPGRRIMAWTSDKTTANFYQDGISIGTAAGAIGKPTGSMAWKTAIGSTEIVDNQRFDNMIFAAWIYDRALSAEEIRQHYYLTSGR